MPTRRWGWKRRGQLPPSAVVDNTTPVPATPAPFFGINTNAQDNTYLLDSGSSGLGLDVLRIEMFNNALVSPTNNNGINTPATAKSIINNAGLKMLPLVQGVVAWSDPSWISSAVSAAAYAGDLGLVEMGNEPFLQAANWPAQQYRDPIGYATMCLNAQQAISAAGYNVKVLVAAGGPTNTDGVTQIGTWPTLDYLKADGVTYSRFSAGNGWINDIKAALPRIDSVIGGWTLHPYQLPVEGGQLIVDAEHCTELPIYITEYGRKSTGVAAENTAQSAEITMMQDEYLTNPGHNVKAAFYYNHKDYPPTGPDSFWALIDISNVKRPAYTTYKNSVAAYRSAYANRVVWDELTFPLAAGQTFFSNPIDIKNAKYTAVVGANPSAVVGYLAADVPVTLYVEFSNDGVNWISSINTASSLIGKIQLSRITQGTASYLYARFKAVTTGPSATMTRLQVGIRK